MWMGVSAKEPTCVVLFAPWGRSLRYRKLDWIGLWPDLVGLLWTYVLQALLVCSKHGSSFFSIIQNGVLNYYISAFVIFSSMHIFSWHSILSSLCVVMEGGLKKMAVFFAEKQSLFGHIPKCERQLQISPAEVVWAHSMCVCVWERNPNNWF